MMKCLKRAVLPVALALMATGAHAEPLRASYADVVVPDAELVAFLTTLAQTAKAGLSPRADAGATYAALDAMFAPTLTGFGRGLDPLEHWRKYAKPVPGNFSDLAGNMIEQGDLPEGASLPDIRPDMLSLLLALIANADEPLGTITPSGDAICSPAAYAFDAKAAAKLAAATQSDAYGLRLMHREITLHAEPKASSPAVATLAPLTIVGSIYVDGQPDGWTQYATSDGMIGWFEERLAEADGLSQQHVCFAKVDGAYKLTSFYTYGL
jgi:hypothetical protein